jgi:hypothetical protein
MIKTLNEDYNGKSKNFDIHASKYTGIEPDSSVYKKMLGLKGNANIQFRLKKTVYRKMMTPLPNNDDMDEKNILVKEKHSPSIKPDTYLNIWVVDGLGGGLLGYATFPWDSIEPGKLKHDGVVIEKATFGAHPVSAQYNQNKTVIHEVGHWTGLYHTFQQGTHNTLDARSIFDYSGDGKINLQEESGDCIADTPDQDVPTYGNPIAENSPWPCTIEGKIKSWHMWMNFMDYSDDECMFMFTVDQVNKMRLMLKMFRAKTVGYRVQNNTTVTTASNTTTPKPPRSLFGSFFRAVFGDTENTKIEQTIDNAIVDAVDESK